LVRCVAGLSISLAWLVGLRGALGACCGRVRVRGSVPVLGSGPAVWVGSGRGCRGVVLVELADVAGEVDERPLAADRA
jgi:hypothetical protein